MTEIPEHLLKRSRDRRAATGASGEGADTAASSSTPATVAPAGEAAPTPAPAAAPVAPTPAPPPPPKPDPDYVRAANERKKMPFWAMGALALLPIWAFLYLRGMQPVDEEVAGPLAVGEEVYASCQSCHGADGQGGAGRPLNEGSVLATFPKIEDQLNLVYTGSEAYALAGIPALGDPNREGGAHAPGAFNGSYMPAQGADAGGSLTDAQILGVVCHERYSIGGGDPAGDLAEEYTEWCSAESEVFAGLEDGSMTLAGIEGVGTEPRPSEP